MAFNLDIAIVAFFLIINLSVGLYFGKGVKTIKDYAIGNRNFSTATIVATIIATWIGGNDFAAAVSETYKSGIWYVVAGTGAGINLIIIAYVFAPKMREFFGSFSVAECMGNLYGKPIRIVTATCSIAQAIGQTALQIKVFSTIFSYFLSFSSIYATIVSSIVVIIYSAWGGIKSVTFTDVIQFFAFGVFVPIFALFIWQVCGSRTELIEVFTHNPIFDYNQLIDYRHPKFWSYLFLLLYFSIPSLNATMFQRTLIAKSTKQIQQSFAIAGIIWIVIHLFSCLIGLVILSHNSGIKPDNVLMYVVDHYSIIGLKGLAVVGIMAMIMSTADSWINTASVIFSHDFCSPLGIKVKNELFLSRIFALFVGTFAVILAILASDLLKLLLLSANFYKPIITVPLMLAVLGFRSSPKVVAIAMFSGGFGAFIWRMTITPITDIDSVIPGMMINLLAYVTSHYLLGKPGGWIKKNNNPNNLENKKKRPKKISALIKFFRGSSDFRLIDYCRTHSPKNELVYYYFAFGVLSSIITTFSLDKITYQQNMLLINSLQAASLFISVLFICRNLIFTDNFKTKYLGLIWYISIFISLAFVSSFLVLISKFSQISLVIFILNLTMIGMLLNWQIALPMIITGGLLAFYSYQYYFGDPISSELYDLKLKILYVIFLISGFMLTFLKPKQEHEELIEEKNKHLDGEVIYKNEELKKSLELKYEFLRNLEHEVRTPITGITSLGQILWENYDKLSVEQRRKAVEDIAKSSERLNMLTNNLIDLSKLSSMTYDLKKKLVNLSDLLFDRIDSCKRMYLNNKDLEFITNIDDEVLLNCDDYYIKATLDNLIINAIHYSKTGQITIKLTTTDKSVEFSIQDEGIGIPVAELMDIFGAFTVSSKTRTPAGGRGIGLALCKKVIEVHGGFISAESNGLKGALFKFNLPI